MACRPATMTRDRGAGRRALSGAWTARIILDESLKGTTSASRAGPGTTSRWQDEAVVVRTVAFVVVRQVKDAMPRVESLVTNGPRSAAPARDSHRRRGHDRPP
jgi:hypothetical protein